MTPYEKEMVEAVSQALEQSRDQIAELAGDAMPPDFMSVVLGSMMAAVDAVFAIRDGRSWRGKDDPREIAHELIRTAHLTED